MQLGECKSEPASRGHGSGDCLLQHGTNSPLRRQRAWDTDIDEPDPA